MRSAFLLDFPLGTPRNIDELIVYILAGAVPLLFGFLRSRQNRNTKEIKYLRRSIAVAQMAGTDYCPQCGSALEPPLPYLPARSATSGASVARPEAAPPDAS